MNFNFYVYYFQNKYTLSRLNICIIQVDILKTHHQKNKSKKQI